MVRGWPLLSGAVLLLLGGRGLGADAADRDTERKAGIIARKRRPPAACTDPPCSQVRSQPAASEPSQGGASRAPSGNCREPATRRVRDPRAPHVARALSVPRLFSWAPQNPRFHRPQLAAPPPPPRFSAMQLQGSLFPRLRIPTLPDWEGRRRAGGDAKGRRGRLGQVSVVAAAGSPAPAPERGGGGLGQEVSLHAAIRRTRARGLGAPGAAAAAWAPARLRLRPAPAASATLRDLGSCSSPQIELRANRFGAGASGRTHPGSAVLRSFFAADFFFP